MTRFPLDARFLGGMLALLAGVADAQTGTVLRVPEARLSLIDRATLSAERTGILDRISVEEGSAVSEGMLVAQLRDQVIRASLATAEKQLENDVDLRFSRKAAELANLEYSKSLKVNSGSPGTISEMELRKLRLASEKALLQMEQADLQLQVLKLQREETRASLATYAVVAPWNGIVMKVLKRRGEAVRDGEPIVEIANFERLRVEAYVPLADSWQLRPGQEVRFQVDVPGSDLDIEDRMFSGKVTFVEPKVEPVTQRVRIWAEVRNAEGLLKEGLQGVMLVGIIAPQTAGKPTELPR